MKNGHDPEFEVIEIEMPEQSEEMDQFALDLAADLTHLVGERLEAMEAEGKRAHDYRYAIMHAHLVGIAGAIHACELYDDANQMFRYFQAFAAGIVANATLRDDLFGEDDDGPMETHSE